MQDIRTSYEKAIENVSGATETEKISNKYALEILHLYNMFALLLNNREITNKSIRSGISTQFNKTTTDSPEIVTSKEHLKEFDEMNKMV